MRRDGLQVNPEHVQVYPETTGTTGLEARPEWKNNRKHCVVLWFFFQITSPSRGANLWSHGLGQCGIKSCLGRSTTLACGRWSINTTRCGIGSESTPNVESERDLTPRWSDYQREWFLCTSVWLSCCFWSWFTCGHRDVSGIRKWSTTSWLEDTSGFVSSLTNVTRIMNVIQYL